MSRYSVPGYVVIVTVFGAGCLVCHLLRNRAGWGAVPASALTGFGGTFVPVPSFVDKPAFQAAIYSGSFAGMCSSEIVDRPEQILWVALLGGVVWLVLTPMFPGIGGKLGAIAFATTALILLAKLFL